MDIIQNCSTFKFERKTNWNAAALHDVKTCTCDRGDIGREKKKEANKKRRKFYKTAKGIAIKKMYKERMELKKSLLRQLLAMNVHKKCQSSYLTSRNL